MLPGTAETERPPGACFTVVTEDKAVSLLIVPVGPGQICGAEFPLYYVYSAVVGKAIVDPVITEGGEKTSVD